MSTQDETLTNADALVVVTEWKEFKSPDFVHLKIGAEVAGHFRRPQSVRAGCDERNSASTITRLDAPMLNPLNLRPMSEARPGSITPSPSLSPALTVVPRAQLAAARVLVVGDVMLDRYWFGDVNRISPEAPVPVVHVQRQEDRLGGAANVARNAAALGAQGWPAVRRRT